MRLSHVKLAQLIGTALLATRSSLDESPSVQPEVVSSLPAGPPGTGQESARCAYEYFSQFR